MNTPALEQRNKKKISFWKKTFSSTWVISIVGGLFTSILTYFAIATYDVFPAIRDSYQKIGKIEKSLEKLNANLLGKIDGGLDIKVGINSSLERNYVVVFADNKLDLTKGSTFYVTNLGDEFKPTIQLFVTEVKVKQIPTDADVFISKEAALLLRFKNYKEVGVGKFKMKKSDESI